MAPTNSKNLKDKARNADNNAEQCLADFITIRQALPLLNTRVPFFHCWRSGEVMVSQSRYKNIVGSDVPFSSLMTSSLQHEFSLWADNTYHEAPKTYTNKHNRNIVNNMRRGEE
ncbi:hypothetical protein RJ641_024202 [Dillenia turbinata]|uniref:Uncharacterized protein n=1 Tax=Dillenia turbinata TaxID=194707 RepID=A0AAN8UG17_9MAGN